MWWGTGKALVMLDLNKYERIKVAPKISLTDVKIKQNQVDFRALKELNHSVDNIDSTNKNLFPLIDILFDSIRPFSNCPTSLEIPYGLNEITFNFYANDWSAPHKLKYNYMLEGLDKNWHSSDNQNNAVYSFIPEGDYIFKIKAIGQSKIWSETVSFNLKVNPPWWRTLWAYIIYLLLVIFAFITFTTIRTTKLRRQRKLLEKLVKLRTQEVVKQKEIVEHKNKEIIDSINYAKRIQRAILPSSGMVKRKLANAFIFFKPKDIVAGDFYWLEERGDKILLAAADCTGHGVPGAMVSLVCNNTLSRTVREFKLEEPHEILNSVREMVIESFANSREEVNDGMDIAFVTLNTKTNLLEYAGANNDLYIISKGEIITLTADRQPIGKYFNNKPFTKKTYQLHSGDTIYMMTDGYIDQFGGPRGKKFKKKGFLELLLGIQNLEMKEQKKIIEKEFDNWKGDLEQIDDVCVIGVRVS
jgi:serine phosphatase RsbU (regulator of sigma subunit)